MRKDLVKLLERCEEQGFRIKATRKQHLQIFSPTGEFVTGVASTPSEYRGWHNMMAQLKRYHFKP